MPETILNLYRETRHRMEVALRVAREALREMSTITPKDLSSLLVVKLTREKMLELFSRPEPVEVCRKCGGTCCSRPISYMNWSDLFYSVAVDPGFGFPEPDWEFLDCSPDRCLFLSHTGCLLGENRPNRCLFYICKTQRPLVPVRWMGNRTEIDLLEAILKYHLNLWGEKVVGRSRSLSSLFHLSVAQYLPVRGEPQGPTNGSGYF